MYTVQNQIYEIALPKVAKPLALFILIVQSVPKMKEISLYEGSEDKQSFNCVSCNCEIHRK